MLDAHSLLHRCAQNRYSRKRTQRRSYSIRAELLWYTRLPPYLVAVFVVHGNQRNTLDERYQDALPAISGYEQGGLLIPSILIHTGDAYASEAYGPGVSVTT
jgi:hypothetical protein